MLCKINNTQQKPLLPKKPLLPNILNLRLKIYQDLASFNNCCASA